MNESDVFTAPWYPWYVNDVLTSERVELMSLTEEGAYRRALDRAWKKGSIPADPVQCAKAIGKRCPVKVAEVVLKMFRPMPNDPTRMINDTLEKVRDEQKQKYLKRSVKGKDAAEKRWHRHTTGIPQAMPKQYHSESDTDKDTEKKEEEGEVANAAPAGIASVSDELAISEIESAFKIQLDLETRKLAAKAVPPDLVEFFPAFIRGRAIGFTDKPRQTKLTRISYSLTDFQKDHRSKNGKSHQPTARERQAEHSRRSVSREEELFRIGMEKRQQAGRTISSGDDADNSSLLGTGEPASSN